jgi:phage gpG-like protein
MLSVEIDGDRELVARFAAMPKAIRAALALKFAALAQRLEDKIRTEKLDGQVLRARSGRLRDSVSSSLDDSGASLFTSGVKYAAAQEFGVSGEESVAAHSRTIKQAFGRAITPKTILIEAFSRQMRLPERSYMRSSLDEMSAEIAQALREAVEEGLQP